MNNVIQPLLTAYRSGRNPMFILQQMSQNDPSIARVMQLFNGKNASQLQTIAYNMAREQGIDINALMHELGLR